MYVCMYECMYAMYTNMNIHDEIVLGFDLSPYVYISLYDGSMLYVSTRMRYTHIYIHTYGSKHTNALHTYIYTYKHMVVCNM